MENQKQKVKKPHPIYVVSGGKGLAGHTMVHSLIIQYPDDNIPVRVVPNVQNTKKIKEVVQKVKRESGLLVHTMVKTKLRDELLKECEIHGVKNVDFMGPLANYLEKRTWVEMFGWKVANIPLISGIKPPPELFDLDPRRVFGLTISLSHLLSIRSKRLTQMGDTQNLNYTDQQSVREDLRHANFIFEKGGFTKINVTNKPIESSANEIIGLVSDRFGYEDRKFNDY